MPEAITAGREIEISQPTGVLKRKPVTNNRLDRAARELNLLKVNARGLLNIATIGRFIDQLGVLNYGTGKLLGSAEMISEAATRCAALAEREDLDDEIRQGYLQLQLRFVKALDENLAMQLEVNHVVQNRAAAPSQALPSKPFLPGAQISPIQINVGAGATIQTTKEEPCKTSGA